MGKIKEFALNRPFLMGLSLIVFYSLFGTLTYPVRYLFPDTEVGHLLGDALGKLLIFLVVLYIIYRLGWIKTSRIANPGRLTAWVVVLPILVYKVVTWHYAFTDEWLIGLPGSSADFATLVYALGTSLVEEGMVRGLLLTAMLISWGNSKRGQVRAVLLSSALFGLIHLFNLLVRPPGVVIFQALVVTLPGILYAVLVMTYDSMWPGIVIHWLTNAVINIQILGIENYSESFRMWLLAGGFSIPILAVSAYLFWRLPDELEYKKI